jgi:hypothetical protein
MVRIFKRQSESYQQPMYNDEQQQEVVQQNDDRHPVLTISSIRISWTVIPRMFQRSVIRRSPFHSR